MQHLECLVLPQALLCCIPCLLSCVSSLQLVHKHYATLSRDDFLRAAKYTHIAAPPEPLSDLQRTNPAEPNLVVGGPKLMAGFSTARTAKGQIDALRSQIGQIRDLCRLYSAWKAKPSQATLHATKDQWVRAFFNLHQRSEKQEPGL